MQSIAGAKKREPSTHHDHDLLLVNPLREVHELDVFDGLSGRKKHLQRNILIVFEPEPNLQAQARLALGVVVRVTHAVVQHERTSDELDEHNTHGEAEDDVVGALRVFDDRAYQ